MSTICLTSVACVLPPRPLLCQLLALGALVLTTSVAVPLMSSSLYSLFFRTCLSQSQCVLLTVLWNVSSLCVDFGSTGLNWAHDPWRSVDYFGRSKIYKKLSSSQKLLIKKRENPRQVQVRPREGTSSEMMSLRPTRRVRTSQCFGSVSKSDVPRSFSNLPRGSSKD